MHKICYIVTIPLTIRAFFVPQLKFLVDNGFEVTVICSQDAKLQRILGDKIKFHPIEIPRGVSFMGMIKAIIELKSFFKKEQFEIVQYSTPNAAFCSSIAAASSRIKVRNYHLMGFRYLGAKGIGMIVLKCFEKITCMCSTHIECVSQSNLDMGVKEHLFLESKATVVWNGSTGGVDLKKFNYAHKHRWRQDVRKELEISEKDILLGFAGRITKDKGIDELIEAFSKLQDNAKLLLIGSMEGVETLNSKLWEWAKNSSNVIIHDEVSDIERYFAAMDVLVLPSYREGFGNVVIEAGAIGIPAIVSNIPGPTDIVVDGITGLICQCKDVDSLYRAMNEIINDSTYLKLGENALNYVVTKYDSVKLCEKILHRKQSLLEKQVEELY